MKIEFDVEGSPLEPTLVLATRNGTIIGGIPAREIVCADYLNEASELQFSVYKEEDGVECAIWDEIENFKLVWCRDWDMWFQLTLDVNMTNETVKVCECQQLGPAELSQIMLYTIEINTENDILRDDYTEPTVLWNPDNPEASLLHRIMEKAPHYSVEHVDSTIKNIQRTFTFDDESLYDAFQDIAEEIGCLFLFPSASDSDGNIARTIEVYDLESNCKSCGYRGEFTGACPECGSTDIDEGYGKDTTIFVTADDLGEEIDFTTDTDAVKNCFKLVAGDDLLTATVRNCNPNGSDYIYYLSDDMKSDMPDELVSKIDSYDELYDYYQNDYTISFSDTSKQSAFQSSITDYNNLVKKYQEYDSALETIPTSIVGYPALMNAYYNTIDLDLYLQSTLMPDVSMEKTTAESEAAKLTAANLSPVAVANIDSVSESTATNAVVNMAKCLVNSRFQVKALSDSTSLSGTTWTGILVVTNYSDDTDTANSSSLTITISGDYETYLRQSIDKTLANNNTDDVSITGLFALSLEEFTEELKKYCLDSLNMFYNCCESCLDILIEQGVVDGNTWGTVQSDSDPYTELYEPYLNKQIAIMEETDLRESEIAIIVGTYDSNGRVLTEGLQNYLADARNYIQNELDFEAYLGEDLWLQFCAYRREDKYSNSNYISDGLNNAEMFELAQEFLTVATKELYKSAELQHSIESTLRNLLTMQKFWPLLDYFEVGNWLRIQVDEDIYKLRLIGFEIDFDDLETLSVDFSDVMKIYNGLTDLQSVVEQASKMATSYDAVQHQASQGATSYGYVEGWSLDGLDVTNTKIIQSADGQDQTWDEHGMLFRKYDDVSETYDAEQLKIVNSTIAITSDNWEHVRTAIGRFYYKDPTSGDYKYAYGINAEVLIGQLILGENLGIYNSTGSLTFDDKGLTVTSTSGNTMTFNSSGLSVTNGTYTLTVDPNSSTFIRIYNTSNSDVLTVTNSGDLTLEGTVTANKGRIGGWYLTATRIRSSDTISIGSSEAGLLLVNEDEKPYINAQDSDGSTTFRVARNGAVTVAGDITATSIKAKDAYYIYDSSNRSAKIISATLGSSGETVTIGEGMDSIYLKCTGNVFTNCPLSVGESGESALTCGNISSSGRLSVSGTSSLQATTVSTLNGYRVSSSNGDYTNGAFIPTVASGGSIDLGRYIDLHFYGTGEYDYGIRMNTLLDSDTSSGIYVFRIYFNGYRNNTYFADNSGMMRIQNMGLRVDGALDARGEATFHDVINTSDEFDMSCGSSNARIQLTNSKGVMRVSVTTDGDAGLYDYTNQYWIIRSAISDKHIYIGGGNTEGVHIYGVYSNTTQSSANLRIYDASGSGDHYQLMRVSSSSISYKVDVRNATDNDISQLFDIPVHWFKYKEGYLVNSDERCDKEIPGFYAEDWEEKLPIAVDHNADGSPEMWNPNIVVPLMFEMIKYDHSNILTIEENVNDLQNRITQLESENAELKQEVASLKSALA